MVKIKNKQKKNDNKISFYYSGPLSPQSLSSALNQTQIVAAQYYSWFHQKVDTYAKI